MELTERKKKILRAIVEIYIDTAEPVGSKAIVDTAGLGFSSATIRNEMADLTAMGYLEQPHTSAGRIPSPKGYRLYVNELMERHRLSAEEAEEINAGLRQRMERLDGLISDVGKLTSQLTNFPAYAMASAAAPLTVKRFEFLPMDEDGIIIVMMLSNNQVKNKLVNFRFPVSQALLTRLTTVLNANLTGITDDCFTPELIEATERSVANENGIVGVVAGFALQELIKARNTETYVAGTSRLLGQPEFKDVNKAHRVMEYLTDSPMLAQLPQPEGDSNIKITIGPENLAEELKDSSVIVARYDAGDNMQGLIGVVGPTRMDYSSVAARLSYIADSLSAMTKGGGLPLPNRPMALPHIRVEDDDE